MSDFTQFLNNSHKNLKNADHMLTQTYPLVKDPKLLIAVMDHIFLSVSNSLDALVFFMGEKKLIPAFQDSFESKYNSFKLNIAKKFDFSTDEINLILDIKKMIEFHKNSPVEFARKDKFVFCSGDYEISSISVQEMKKYIKKADLFLKKVEDVISKTNKEDLKNK